MKSLLSLGLLVSGTACAATLILSPLPQSAVHVTHSVKTKCIDGKLNVNVGNGWELLHDGGSGKTISCKV